MSTYTNNGTEASVDLNADGAVLINHGTVQFEVFASSTKPDPGVFNYGLIGQGTGSTDDIAVYFYAGGTVTNGTGATIIGRDGVEIGPVASGHYHGRGVVTNHGTITGDYYGVVFADGGSVTNSGSISGDTGISILHTTGTVSNTGRIEGTASGSGNYGVYLNSGSVSNGSAGHTSAYIGAAGKAAIKIDTGTGSVTNYGTIEDSYSSGSAVDLNSGGSVTNGAVGSTAALIEGAGFGVYIGAGPGTVTNFGTIEGTGADSGVELSLSGTVINDGTISSAGGAAIQAATGTIENGSATDHAALIEGYNDGVELASGTVTNHGTIESIYTYGNGVYVSNGGTLVNGSASDTGALIEGQYAVYGTSGALTVENFGTIAANFSDGTGVCLGTGGGIIDNGTNGSSSALIEGGTHGVNVEGGSATVTNYGTISGSADSVVFTTTGDVLVVETGARFDGLIAGGGGTLELAGGTGTLTGLGSTGTFSVGASGTFSGFGSYVIAIGGDWTLDGSNTIANGAGLSVDGGLVDAGTLVLDGEMTVAGTLSGSGTIELAGGTLDASVAISVGPLDFTGSGLIDLAQGGNYSGIDILNFGANDAVDLTNIAYAAGESVTYDGGFLYLYSGHTLLAEFDATKGTGFQNFIVADAGGHAEIETFICFMAGTAILTPAGAVPVELLAIGDLVTTAEGGATPIRWIGRQTVSTRFADPLRALPIRITADAIAEALPARDLLCSPDHAVLVDGVLVQAAALVNGTTIRREATVPEIFTYWHIECDGHELILAEGLPAETFIDNADRLAFDNWAEHQALFPDGKRVVELPLPRAKARRQVPLAIRERLARRAAQIAGRTRAAA